MYCPNCGAENDVTAVNCKNCGVSLSGTSNVNNYQSRPVVEDKPNLGINIISLCCIPILGIIMFFVWKDSKPIAAKSALIWGLCGIALIVMFYVVIFTFGVITTFDTTY